MLPERYRRLWSRRLRRRPLLPFLLAALVAIDLVALNLTEETPSDGVTLMVMAVLGAQLGLLAIWTTHAVRAWAPRLTVAVTLLVIAAMPVTPPNGDAYARPVLFSIFGLTCLGLIATRAAISAWRPSALKPRRLRFGISTLLWSTLLVAILIAALRGTEWWALAAPLTLVLCLVELPPTIVLFLLDKAAASGNKRWLCLLGAPLALFGLACLYAAAPRGGPAIIGTPQDFLPYYTLQAVIIGGVLIALTPMRRKQLADPPEQGDEPMAPQEPETIDLSV